MVEGLEDAPRVLIVADYDLFRTKLRSLLEEQGVNVVGEAADRADSVLSVSLLNPDLVVMDVPRVAEATWQIIEMVPWSPVLVLASDDDYDHLLHARLAGASGSLPKNSSAPELIAAIRAAAIRPRSIPPEDAARIVQFLELSQRESRLLQRTGSRLKTAVARFGIGKPRVVMRLMAQEPVNPPLGVAELAFALAAIVLVFMVARGLIAG
jgi:DNA-binding NarL/FixJ family response regulator